MIANMSRKFEWDENKNVLNRKNHHISFEYAARVFNDPYMLDIYDEEHSGYNKYKIWEDRYGAIGLVEDILYVVYTIRKRNDEEVHRIISARLADPDEIQIYKRNRDAF